MEVTIHHNGNIFKKFDVGHNITNISAEYINMDSDERVSPIIHVVFGVALVVFAIASAVGNSLVLVLIWRFKTLRTYTNFLITNLAIADLGISLFGFPISATSNFGHGWIMGTVGCQWYGFTGMLFGIANIGFLTTISLDRYLLTCRHTIFLKMGFRHYLLLAIASWSNAAFWATGPMIGWCRYAIDSFGTSCTVNWNDRSGLYMSYVLSIFGVSFLFPGTAIVFFYMRTWRFIKAVGEGGQQENIEWTHEKQVAKMCAVAISLFLLAWTPYAIVCLWAAFGDPRKFPPHMSVIPSLFAKSSACYNPFLYALLNKRFRLAVQKLCGFVKTNSEREQIRLHQLME